MKTSPGPSNALHSSHRIVATGLSTGLYGLLGPLGVPDTLENDDVVLVPKELKDFGFDFLFSIIYQTPIIPRIGIDAPINKTLEFMLSGVLYVIPSSVSSAVYVPDVPLDGGL